MKKPTLGFGVDDRNRLHEVLVSRGAASREEADATAHALVDIARSVERVYGDLVPKITDEAHAREINDSLWEIRDEFRHIEYHMRDAKLTRL